MLKRIQYNAPVTLSFALISLAALLLSQVDVNTYKKLGANLTCDPVYQSKKLYHRG